MTRFARAGWCVREATGGAAAVARSSSSSEARAIVPSPTAHRPKKWRRVVSSVYRSWGFMKLFSRDELVQVEEYPTDEQPGRPFAALDLQPVHPAGQLLGLVRAGLACQDQPEGVAES